MLESLGTTFLVTLTAAERPALVVEAAVKLQDSPMLSCSDVRVPVAWYQIWFKEGSSHCPHPLLMEASGLPPPCEMINQHGKDLRN